MTYVQMDAAEVTQAIANVAPKIRSIMQLVKEGKAAAKSRADEIVLILRAHGLSWNLRVPNVKVAIPPANRFGQGVTPSDVVKLILMILEEGWSWPEVIDKARAFEKKPRQASMKQLDLNRKWVAQSDEMLAPITDDCWLLSVTCTHTSQGLRCVMMATKGCSDDRFGFDGHQGAPFVPRANRSWA